MKHSLCFCCWVLNLAASDLNLLGVVGAEKTNRRVNTQLTHR